MDNLRGAALMTAAMAGFAIEDMFVKRLTESLPVGQILVLLGVGGAAIFAAVALLRGDRLFSRDLFARPVLWRNAGEIVGTIGFVSALALTSLVSTSAILQALPLAVTLGAAVFLKAPVGWRRWSAIGVGMVGVLMIVRPGLSGFEPASLFAVLSVAGLATRDIATRLVPRSISSFQLAAYGFATLVPLGLGMLALGPEPAAMDVRALWQVSAALGFGVLAYYMITAAMRVGEIPFVTPFRYTRLIFALIIGAVVFAERPDAWTLAGAAVIIASGLYSLLRERALARRGRLGF